ncbi:MAG: cation transporter [Firmicutes bacterium]|nr:heavy-metal-associated domain-containing protein [Alicyclobacillaceae bacterium]MCL6497822.1 cation transporter [Bacillota bacterium]
MEHVALHIAGMSCDHCVRAVRQALLALPGVQAAAVSIGEATVDYDPARVSLDELKAAVRDAGYDPA